MGLPVEAANDAAQEIARATNKLIRLFKVAELIASEPGSDTVGHWSVCAPQTVGKFSAAGYFFGREVNKALNVPIGLIDCTFGGTPIDAWISRPCLERFPNCKKELERWDKIVRHYPQDKRDYAEKLIEWREKARENAAAGKKPPAPPQPLLPLDKMGRPASLFNGMIAPVAPFAIKGVIWNQGEADVGLTAKYLLLFPVLIADWRAHWLEGDFPFYYVQLHNYMDRQAQPKESKLAELREAQKSALTLPHTGMVVAIDLGGKDNSIHYLNKQEVGHRLASAVLSSEYGQKVVAFGPTYESATVEGNKIRVRFKHAEGGLTAKEGQPLTGFAIAGPDHRFVWANATIDGDSVLVSSPQFDRPVAVRYAWANNPECNLINSAGLPAAPFRSMDLH